MLNSKEETAPEAFLNGARGYCEAANTLFDAISTKKQNQLLLDPIYMLYFHATELTLKAFLRHKGLKTEELRKKKLGHNLSLLYAKCVEMGLASSKKGDLDLHNITELLDSGNSDSAFRYWNPKSLTTASIEWVKKVVNNLIGLVEKYIPMDEEPEPAVKVTITVGEPVPK